MCVWPQCPTPETLQQCDTPDKAAAYWQIHIATHPYYNPECECLAVLLLNTRRRVKGHHIVSIGSQDSILVHPREVYRLAIITAACAVIVMHIRLDGKPCRVVRVTDCSAVVAVTKQPREFTTLFGVRVRIQPKPGLVRISPQSEVPILNR
jgi:hypothetical protein